MLCIVLPRRLLFLWGMLAALFLAVAPARAEKNLARPPGTTRYAPMVAQLNALLTFDRTQGAHRMTLTSIGQSVKGRALWMVTLRDPSPLPAGSDALGSDAPKRVFFLCRQHGHEPASTEGALQFVTQLVQAAPGSPLAEQLMRVTVYVVPMANPDGAEAFRRHNAHDADINRDWLRRREPETRALYHAVLTVRPDMMTDQHELYPDDTRPDFTEAAGAGSGASLQVVDACSDDQFVVQACLAASGFCVVTHTVTDTHPARLAHRYGGIVLGIPTLLFETNRLAGSGRTVAARAQAHLRFMQTVLRDLSGERAQMLAEAASAPGSAGRQAMLLASHKQAFTRAGVPAAKDGPPAPIMGSRAGAGPLVPNNGGTGEGHDNSSPHNWGDGGASSEGTRE